MGIAFKQGDTVRQIVKPIEGTVQSAEIIGDDICYRVAYVGQDGEPHERVFKEDEIQANG